MRKGFRKFKGKYYCYLCYVKSVKMTGGVSFAYTLEQALNKVYEIKGRVSKNGYLTTDGIYFPKVLIGKRFKIKIIENE